MSCKYRENCPCCSGWCEGPKQNYERCIPFLLMVHERDMEELDRSEDKLTQARETINRIRQICDGRG